jgi:hypothetical protein
MEATPNLSAVHSHSKALHSNAQEVRQEALARAVSGQSFTNFPAIFAGFAAKGIPESEIKPRENVFTFNAWKALGRVVRRGEHEGNGRRHWRAEKFPPSVDHDRVPRLPNGSD